MFALVLESKSSPFVIKDVAMPPVGDDDVLVNIKAAAFNHRDYFIQQGLYPRTTFPLIIGSDGAGVVVDVGKNVSRLPAQRVADDPTRRESSSGKADSIIGSEVVINPSLNWGSNPNFANRDYKILGFPDQGTFAEFVAVPARLVHPKPRHLSWEESAALPLAAMTAFRAVFTKGNVGLSKKNVERSRWAGIAPSTGMSDSGESLYMPQFSLDRPDENVLITGIGGGVALCAMQFALAAGAKVFVTSGSDEKIQKAIALGAHGGVNYKKENWASELTKLAPSFDLIVDGAVGNGFAKLLDLASFGGRIVIYGSTQGKSPNAEPARIFWKQLSILGTTMATDDEFVAMLRFVEQHSIRPVVDSVFSFEKANDALQRMAKGEQFGKIVLQNPERSARLPS